MNQKRFTNIILALVIIAGVVVGVYYIFTKEPEVTQIQKPESTISQDDFALQDSLEIAPTFVGTWKVVLVQEDSILIVSEGSGATIEFFRDGTIKAFGGCNEMMPGSYEVQADSKLSISIGGTKRMCAKDIAEFWDLNKVYSYEFTDDFLLLYYKTESEVKGFFRLARVT